MNTQFRPEFVEQIIGFFGEQFDSLRPRERAHAIGVVVNTLAALALNETRSASVDGMRATLGILSDSSNNTIGRFVQDKSTSYLRSQSLGICKTVRDAIAQRQQ